MMGSHWPIFLLITFYLYFVRKLGPSLMANRKPFSLKYAMILYNIFQVVANAAFLLWVRNNTVIVFQLMKLLMCTQSTMYISHYRQLRGIYVKLKNEIFKVSVTVSS